MPKNKKVPANTDLNGFLKELNIDSKELLSAIIEVLQKFCHDNILALYPLSDENAENDPVQERICYFAVISNILDSVNKLAQADVTFITKEKKKLSKKKDKKKRI